MLLCTSSFTHVACDDTDNNRYSTLSTSYNYNISHTPHYCKFQTFISRSEQSQSCFLEVSQSAVSFAGTIDSFPSTKLHRVTVSKKILVPSTSLLLCSHFFDTNTQTKMSVSIESVTGYAQRRSVIGHIENQSGTELRSASSLFTD
jgi:hypothetical protein